MLSHPAAELILPAADATSLVRAGRIAGQPWYARR
jgi:hypothetical protein